MSLRTKAQKNKRIQAGEEWMNRTIARTIEGTDERIFLSSSEAVDLIPPWKRRPVTRWFFFRKSEILIESENFWTYRPEDKSIQSKSWRGSWFWGPFGRGSSKSTPNLIISQKRKFWSKLFRRFFFFGVEKRNVRNRLKPVLAKFRGDPSHVRAVTKKFSPQSAAVN